MAGNEELFGLIAIRSNLIKRSNLAEALASQESEGTSRRRIGEILVSKELLTEQDIIDILHVQALLMAANPDMQFVIDAIQENLLSDAQVDGAMSIQADENYARSIAEILVTQGAISQEDCDRVLENIGARHGDGSKLVEIIQRATQAQDGSAGLDGLDEARFNEAKRLVEEGVGSLLHLGIISHMVHHQGDSYDLKHFVRTLEEDRRQIQTALEDLVNVRILVKQRRWAKSEFSFTPDADMRLRVELLLLCCNDPRHRREMFSMLLHR